MFLSVWLGRRFKGNDARKQNCTAAIAIANVIKSSLGPVGLDKMIVSAAGDVMVTNDGATILQQLMVPKKKEKKEKRKEKEKEKEKREFCWCSDLFLFVVLFFLFSFV